MAEHLWCNATWFCDGCGLSLEQYLENAGPLGCKADCPEDNPYLAAEARGRMRALIDPILKRIGKDG